MYREGELDPGRCLGAPKLGTKICVPLLVSSSFVSFLLLSLGFVSRDRGIQESRDPGQFWRIVWDPGMKLNIKMEAHLTAGCLWACGSIYIYMPDVQLGLFCGVTV